MACDQPVTPAAIALIADLKTRAVADLKDHPGSSAAEVTTRLRYHNSRLLLAVLADAEREGLVQRWRQPPGPWLWEPTDPP